MRQTIQEDMSKLGTHNHVVWDLVKGALQRKGSSGFTKIALYYIYMRCKKVADINSHFQPFLDRSMSGDAKVAERLSKAANNRKRKLKLTKRKVGINARNNRFEKKLQIAKALNCTDELKLLLLEAKSGLIGRDNSKSDADKSA
jgi:hypothetical protein